MDHAKLERACRAFIATVDGINGIYLDATSGFRASPAQLHQRQAWAIEDLWVTKPQLASVEYLDSCQFIYGIGDPNDPTSTVQHQCTQGEYKARHAEGGANWTFLANVCLVSMYQFWEEHFRQEIADSLGCPKNDVTAPIFGDLRRLRQSIIHNGGIATSELEQGEMLHWFRRGQQVALSRDQFGTVIKAVVDATWSIFHASSPPHAV